jgi:hypothetical protein
VSPFLVTQYIWIIDKGESERHEGLEASDKAPEDLYKFNYVAGAEKSHATSGSEAAIEKPVWLIRHLSDDVVGVRHNHFDYKSQSVSTRLSILPNNTHILLLQKLSNKTRHYDPHNYCSFDPFARRSSAQYS